MPVPSHYTEASLRMYMLDVTGGLGTRLELATGDFYEAVSSALLSYGVDDINQATDMAKLRAVARMEAWRTAWNKATGAYDFTADGSSFKRSDLAKQAQAQLEQAEREAMSYGAIAGYAVTTARMGHANDPYQVREEA
jgi:hypothetical protein